MYNIQRRLDRGGSELLWLLDLTAAFVIVDHDLLTHWHETALSTAEGNKRSQNKSSFLLALLTFCCPALHLMSPTGHQPPPSPTNAIQTQLPDEDGVEGDPSEWCTIGMDILHGSCDKESEAILLQKKGSHHMTGPWTGDGNWAAELEKDSEN